MPGKQLINKLFRVNALLLWLKINLICSIVDIRRIRGGQALTDGSSS